jgi:two-component system, NtrC family, sensor histidine kinase PilS
MDSRLEHQLKRLMLLRVVMITTLLLVAIYVETVSETLLRVNPLYFLIIATYLLTIGYVMALRLRVPPHAQIYAQVVLDLLIITGLVYLTGGSSPRAGFMLLYPIAVLGGGVLLHRGRGVVLAGIATLFYASLLLAVRERVIPSYGLEDVVYTPVKHVLYSIFVTGVSCVTVAMIGGYLSHSLSQVGAQLEEVSEQVADLQELNRVIVQSIHSGLLMADEQGRVIYVNRYGEVVLGRPTADIKGRTLREVFGSHLFDLAAVAARAADDKLARFEAVYQRGEGTPVVDLGVSAMPLATHGPQRGGYLLVFQDLTEVKRLEREVRVSEKLAAVGEMAAQLAHEIRNPLGAISGSAQVLMAEADVTDDQNRLLSIITRESRRLSDALNQFLYQARPARMGAGPVDLAPLIEEAVALLINGPEVKPEHRLNFQRDSGPHVCLADADQLLQVFWNLARNGLEAMPAGGTLRVELLRRGDEVLLVVSDEGHGLGEGDPHLLFEPLRSGSRMGTGLGLAIVYRIVREHLGDITMRNTASQGTEVEVRLPAVVPAAANRA